MSDNKQMQNPYPRGSGSHSVPVLFSLRNVQPSIVVKASSEPSVAPPSLPTTSSAPEAKVASVQAAVSSAIAKRSQSSNRIYNGSIAFLVLVLLVLAVRNSQNRISIGTQAKVAATNTDNKNKKETTELSVSAPKSGLNSVAIGTPIPTLPSLVLENVASRVETSPSTLLPSQSSNSSLPNSSGNTSMLVLASSGQLEKVDSVEKVDTVPKMDTVQKMDTNEQPSDLRSPTAPKPSLVPALLGTAAKKSGEASNETGFILETPTANRVTNEPGLNLSQLPNTSVPALADTPVAPKSSATPLASPTIVPHAPPVDGIVDTGVQMTTRELIDAFRTAPQATALATNSQPVMSATTVSNTVPHSTSVSSARVPTMNSADSSGPIISTQRPYTPVASSSPTTHYTPIHSSPNNYTPIQATPAGYTPNSTATSQPSFITQPSAPGYQAMMPSANNAQLMSGQAYPPIKADYPPINKDYQPISLEVPAYEQNAIQYNPSGPGTNMGVQPPQTIRQPSSTSSNRYQGTLIQP
jgi:hypothetical protein